MEQGKDEQMKQLNDEQERFSGFKEWFKQNGGLLSDIDFPVRFEPGNYLGISAKNQIKANSVIIAVPKEIVVSISKAKSSQLKQIYEKYHIFSAEKDDDSDYNILCLFLIMQKMKGSSSFFYPYIKLLDSSETVMNWTDAQIQSIKDPYINTQFINSIRRTFQPIFNDFVEITLIHEDLFPETLTKKMFDEVYAAVMTRGFGWGLPETMLVPFADFLNHSSTGVNHYVFDKCLENRNQLTSYIKKKYQLNLSIFPGFNNKKMLPIDYEPNIRQNYIYEHRDKLKELKLKIDGESVRMDPCITNPLYNMLVEPLIEESYEDQIYLSTDSEDNDSDSQAQGLEETNQFDDNLTDTSKQTSAKKLDTVLMARKYLRFAFKQVEKDLDSRFTEPKPNVNAEFEDGVKFDWWFQDHQVQEANQSDPHDQKISIASEGSESQKQEKQDKYFIVSSSNKIDRNQQIFNCYGRRSNRFLLIWYGFCFQNNKYDSVPFRIWSSQISKRTGKTLYTKFLTQVEYKEGIPIGNERYNAYMLSEEFRLKNRKIDYKLIAFLRYRFLKANRIYKQHYKKKEFHINTITSIHMEIECFQQYQKYLHILLELFHVELQFEKNLSEIFNYHQNSSKSSRQYFRSILQKSNQAILIKNMLAVKQILAILYEIQIYLDKEQKREVEISSTNESIKKSEQEQYKERIKWKILPKESLLNLYKKTFTEIQKEHKFLFFKLQKITGRQKKQIIIQLKIMVREYFRQLSRSVLCRTLYAEFK